MGNKPQLFGTDGMRGVAGEYPLDRETVWRLGCALGRVLGKKSSTQPLQVVIGQDTRESSAWISQALAAGLRASDVEITFAGVITTPGVAFLTRDHGFAAGAMVSASHNPFEDNGIKVLSNSGMKLPESWELEIEQELQATAAPGAVPASPEISADPQLLNDYVDFLLRLVPQGRDLSRFRLVVDCAHGASSRVVPEILRRLGIEARILHAEPNGRNINLGCGSLHPEIMASETKVAAASLGVAFDGDADRAIFATGRGRIADGDHVLYVCARDLLPRGQLKGAGVVGTLMSNLGLELALARRGISLKRTAVGDKYVLEEMLRSGMNLGGEPSGHIIFADVSLAGDGLITLLEVLRVLDETGESLEDLVADLKQFPQIIRNVRVRKKPPLESVSEIAQAVADCQHEFGARGRVVVRYSGTEQVARVMVEAEEAEAVERHAARIASAIEAHLGVR
jgi:phosphoglucosamine mutase